MHAVHTSMCEQRQVVGRPLICHRVAGHVDARSRQQAPSRLQAVRNAVSSTSTEQSAALHLVALSTASLSPRSANWIGARVVDMAVVVVAVLRDSSTFGALHIASDE
jgi:hypothetical protein